MRSLATIIFSGFATFLTACASNHAYPAPKVPVQSAYVEVSGYGIRGTKVIHLYITFKREGEFYFHTVEKLSKEHADGTHYHLNVGYGGLRVRKEPYIVLTGEEAKRVIEVATSQWARDLAKDYDYLDHNSNEFISKILDRADIDRAALPKGAWGK